jgi:hypothetical protein
LTEAALKTSSWNRSKNGKKFLEDVTDPDDDCILFLPTSFPAPKFSSTSVSPPSSPEKTFTEKKIGKGDRRRKRTEKTANKYNALLILFHVLNCKIQVSVSATTMRRMKMKRR